ncbi:MAG TPA: tRNA pseudouridine(65) synthase TruC [Candidatus Tenderia electrophaga]|uniref:tRNA pseudouridine synthase C n=1 Tax=Candidatus Tenderia electrophaga TaxID=1748243 RepID=A0A832J791_9GAMM|nr:tRNA pseudouridine(65) synthase TruC [Candidatus Tenderia electrophaga]
MEILYQDEHLVAVNKPSGLLVHRSMIDKHETRFALQLVRNQIGQRVYPVHRLDKPTSGVLLFALDSETARLLGQQFTDDKVHKQYLAVVRGYSAEYEVIDYPLKRVLDKMTDVQADQDKQAQAAVTEYVRLATAELAHPVGPYQTARYSLLQLMPKTGRKHQLRRHMKHIFHPIVGDTSHGDGRHNQFFRQQFECQRLLLAATAMSFQHPHTAVKVELRASLDAVFEKIINELGWRESYQRSL